MSTYKENDQMMNHDISALPGLKETDLETCALCGKHHEAPVFYRVTIDHCAFDGAAMKRQIGLGMMMGGNAHIAQALGPNEDMAKIVSSERKTVCLACAMSTPLAALIGE